MLYGLPPCRHCGSASSRIVTAEFGRIDWCPACVSVAVADSPSDSLEGLGPLLRRLLAERALTQTALASRLGINRVGIARLVTRRREATADMCEKIAAALELTPAERRTLHGEAARERGYKF